MSNNDFYKKYIKKNETIKSCLDAGLDLKLYNYNIWYVDDLLNESYKNMEYVGETIERKAKEKLVNFKFEPQYVNFYSYLMREVMRNVIEHSKSQKLILLIYKNEKYEFGFKVFDDGIGIKESLNSNPRYNVEDDITALAFSIRPGITRSYKRDPYREEVWQNSGFGLYMVSNIINKIGGYFEIASNSARITIKNGFINHSQNKIQGTEVTAVFNTKIKINIAQLIGKVATKGNEIAANNKVSDFSKYAEVKTASKASTLIK